MSDWRARLEQVDLPPPWEVEPEREIGWWRITYDGRRAHLRLVARRWGESWEALLVHFNRSAIQGERLREASFATLEEAIAQAEAWAELADDHLMEESL